VDHGCGPTTQKARKNHAGQRLNQLNGLGHAKEARPEVTQHSGFRFVFQHLATTVKTVGADVVTQVDFAGGGLHRDTGHVQRIVRTVHATLGRGLFVLLNSHGVLLKNMGEIGNAPVDFSSLAPCKQGAKHQREACDYSLK
jgi:hypothetical protein